MSPDNNLTLWDYQILEVLQKNQSLKTSVVKSLLPNQEAIELRLNLLFRNSYITIEKSNALDVKNPDYKLARRGIKALEDWYIQQKTMQRRLWEDRILKILPIMISLIALIKSFWPEISALLQSL